MSHHVLCAEDDEIVRKMEHALLKARGFEVQLASDGQEAFEMAVQNPPVVIVTDLRMPILDGLDLIIRLRTDPDFPPIPIVLFTAYPRDDRRAREAAEFANVHYLSKSEVSELVPLLRQLAPPGPA